MTEPSSTPTAETPAVATPAPAPTASALPEAPAPAKPAAQSPAVLALGFIIMVLLGALLFVNLQPKTAQDESDSVVAARLKKDTETLLNRTDLTKGEITKKDALLSAKEAALREAERTSKAFANQYASLKVELDKALAEGASADIYKNQLTAANARMEQLGADLTKARNQIAEYSSRPNPDDLADLQRRLEEALRAKGFFETRVKELEVKLATADPSSELQRLRDELARLQAQLGQTRLFASNEQELVPAGVELFQALQKLENLNNTEILAAYTGFRSLLGAKVVKNLTFPTGSSTPSLADDEAVRATVRTLPDDGLLLVVGYASKSGNPDDNRTLSSQRATAVAKSLDAAKLPGQKVQAVYLGATDRFGKDIPESNQLCEIWQIRAKK